SQALSASGSKNAFRIRAHGAAMTMATSSAGVGAAGVLAIGRDHRCRDSSYPGDRVADMSQQPLAYLDAQFLESEEGRPLRILSEYLEPLRRFKDQKIQDTVVFFGSARVDSRERAERALKTLRARGMSSTGAQFQAELTRSRKHVDWARFYEDAREVA